MFRTPERLQTSYDVVIIGAGGHGLAAAYYLARDHGISNVAVLEQGYIGGGNTGRNTTIARACGKQNVHHLEREDLVAMTVEAAAMARVPPAGTN